MISEAVFLWQAVADKSLIINTLEYSTGTKNRPVSYSNLLLINKISATLIGLRFVTCANQL